MTNLHQTVCDACEKHAAVGQTDGWFSVKSIIASQAVYESVLTQAMAGTDPLLHGDFCSLKCVANWAMSAAVLAEMEPGD